MLLLLLHCHRSHRPTRFKAVGIFYLQASVCCDMRSDANRSDNLGETWGKM